MAALETRPSLEETAQLVAVLWEELASVDWRIGDAVNGCGPGNARFLSTMTGVPTRRLEACAEVAAAFPPDVREALKPLSWHYFKAVVHLPQAEAVELLEKACDEGWPISKLGREVRGEPEPEIHVCPDCGKRHKKGTGEAE